ISQSGATATGSVFGTPAYMAPEQLRGAKFVEPKSDIYSLGVVLFLMATGRLPFVEEDLQALIGLHLDATPPRPSSLRPVSSDLDAIIIQCLEKSSQARPSAIELRDQLRGVLPVVHRPVRAEGRRWRSLGIGMIGAAVAISTWAFIQGSGAPPIREQPAVNTP